MAGWTKALSAAVAGLTSTSVIQIEALPITGLSEIDTISLDLLHPFLRKVASGSWTDCKEEEEIDCDGLGSTDFSLAETRTVYWSEKTRTIRPYSSLSFS